MIQKPEFISDTDTAIGITKGNYKDRLPFKVQPLNAQGPALTPFGANDDSYQCYINRTAASGTAITMKTPIFAANGSVKYAFVLSNATGQILYRRTNGAWSLNATDNNAANTPMFSIDAATGVIKTASDFSALTNLPNSISFDIRASSQFDSTQYDNASVTDGLPMVNLEIDSDNNGYINTENTEANNFRRDAENKMKESTPKPITYFPNATGVQNDYIYEPLRVAFDEANHVGLKYSFHYTANIKVCQRNGNTYTELASNYKKLVSNNPLPSDNLLQGDENYYVKAVGTGNGVVHLVLWDASNNEMVRDTISVKAAQTPDDWIVPRGWHIHSPDSFTTMTPVEGAVGPKTEGNSIVSYNGYAYSKNVYGAKGFTMEFAYSFTRNGVNGYFRPDTNKDEVIDDNDDKKVSFVGNSGIKLGSHKGSGDGIWEVAILDMPAMVALVSTVNDFKALITTRNTPISDPPSTDNPMVVFPTPPAPAKKYTNEELTRLMNGVGYNKPLHNIDGSIVPAPGVNKTPEQLFQENYTKFSGNGGTMKIVFDAVTNGIGTLSVYIKENGTYPPTPYYKATNVPITGNGLDGRVYIQSHWGSGVTFSDVTITPNP